MEALQQLDERWLIWLNNLGDPSFDFFFLLLSRTDVWIPLYALIAILLFKNKGAAVGLLSLSLLVLGVILTDQGSVLLFKEMFERPRPCHVQHLEGLIRVVKGCGGKYGFVSSHAANTFGFAWLAGTLLKAEYPRLRTGLLLWAALVSYSRIYLGVHYPFDILGGVVWGLFVATFLVLIAKRRGWVDSGIEIKKK